MSRELINNLKSERKQLVEDSRALLNKCDAEKRDPTAEEEARYKALEADVDKKTARIEREEKLLEAELRTRSIDPERPTPITDPETRENLEQPEIPKELRELHTKALRHFIMGGPSDISDAERRAVLQVHKMLNIRDMSAFGAGQSQMLAPQELSNQIIKDLEKITAIYEMGSRFQVNTLAGLGVVTEAEDSEEAEMTAELTAPAEASDLTFGKRELRPHQTSKMIKLPITLLQSSTFPVETMAGQKLTRKFGRTYENKFATGSGAQEPLGLFTASAFGIDTDRDAVCGSDTNYTWDGIIDVEAALRDEYRPGAKFLLPRNGQTRLRKLKDGEGRYIWEPSVRIGEPDRILGYEYKISDYCPATFTTGLYVGMFGDFSNYWIVEFAFTYVQKLVELYALTNQVALIGRRWFDGMPIQPKAFVRMKLG